MRLASLLTLAALTTVAAVPAAASRSTTPTVRIVKFAPLTVAGAHFKPDEQLKLRVTLAGRHEVSRTTRTSARGAFLVTLGESIHGDRCNSVVRLRIIGPNGQSVGLKSIPFMCAPARTP